MIQVTILLGMSGETKCRPLKIQHFMGMEIVEDTYCFFFFFVFLHFFLFFFVFLHIFFCIYLQVPFFKNISLNTGNLNRV